MATSDRKSLLGRLRLWRWRWEVREALLPAVGVLTVLVTLLLDLSKGTLVRLPAWLSERRLYLIGAVLAVGGVVLKWLGDQRQARQERRQSQTELLAQPPMRAGDLRTVAEADPYGEVGVSPSRYVGTGDDRYVARSVDDDLDGALQESSFVLLAGKSAAGKTRTAFEAIRRTLPDATLLIPRPSQVLAKLLDLDPPLPLGAGAVVIWLDDLDRYLGEAAGLDLGFLERLADLPRRVVVVATIRSEQRQRLLNTPEIGRAARTVLNSHRIKNIDLESELNEEEAAAARQMYPQEDFERGIGEQLVAAPELERRYKDGHASSPIGWALVQAAIDWQRAGMVGPISEPDLRALYPNYLPKRGYAVISQEQYDKGLDWALEKPEQAPVALLERVAADPDAFQIFDYVVACADGQGTIKARAIPETTWNSVIDLVTPWDLPDVGWSASTRGAHAAAERAWRTAMASDDSYVASRAAASLAAVLQQRGDDDGAEQAFQTAMRFDDVEVAPGATLGLGLIRQRRGDTKGAQLAFEQAAASDHWQWAPFAALELGKLRRQLGDLDGARAALEKAASSATSLSDNVALEGAFYLGTVLWEQGDLAGAQDAFERAAVFEDSEWAIAAIYKIGLIRREQGDGEGAEAAFGRAAAYGKGQSATRAAFNLGQLASERGDLERARAAYEQVIASGDEELVPRAAWSLAFIYLQRHDFAEARKAFDLAISRHPEDGPLAEVAIGDELWRKIGDELWRQEDLQTAKAAYARAMASGHAWAAPYATAQLGGLSVLQGRIADGRRLLEQAVTSGHARAAARAIQFLPGLAGLLIQQKDLQGARAVAEQAVDENGNLTPQAKLMFGLILFQEGDLPGAQQAYEQAIASGLREVVPAAWLGLGHVREKQGDEQGARTAYEQAMNSGDPAVAEQASKALADLGAKSRKAGRG